MKLKFKTTGKGAMTVLVEMRKAPDGGEALLLTQIHSAEKPGPPNTDFLAVNRDDARKLIAYMEAVLA